MGIPTGLALYTVSLEGMKSTENVLDRTGHDMMNAGFSVGRRRTLKENIGPISRSRIDAFLERILALPIT